MHIEDAIMDKSKILSKVIFILLISFGQHQVFAEEWKRDHFLDKDSRFRVLWSADKEEIVFQVEVEAKGYVALGLSQNGAMRGSDIVTGWVKDGEVHFQDRHGIGNVMPLVDNSQDWHILYGSENNTHTVLKFKRKLETCDEEEDLEIKDENILLIYAYSETDPVDYNMIQYHRDKKGAKSVLLLQKDVTQSTPKDGLKYWDAVGPIKVAVPSELTTTLWCHILKIPDTPQKNHIVRAELIITPGNAAYIHHITLYSAEGVGFEEFVGTRGYNCDSPPFELPSSNKYKHTGFVLGIGAEALDSSPRAGVVFGNTEYKYYRLNIHYENPTHKDIVDNSGLRLFYTPFLRPFDMGRWFAGIHLNSFFAIPPKRKSFVVAMHDDLRCASEHMPQDGIRIVGALVHMHAIGRRGSIRHFRQGKELKPILDNVNYDYLYQNVIELKEEAVFLPGDQITTECVYDSTERNFTTFAGGASSDEMCLGTINYYPELPYFKTTSGSSRALMLNLLGISRMSSLLPQEADDLLKYFDWTTVNITNYENALRYSPREVTCMKESREIYKHGVISYPLNLKSFERSDICSNRIQQNNISISRLVNIKIKATEVSSSSTKIHSDCLKFQFVVSVLVTLWM